ncbi:MAG: Holliday junction resolvase RuvX [Patescibacteria group bacterium]|nr:Holliday junction resolvase RuvX [Patescibacteria group bacterium]
MLESDKMSKRPEGRILGIDFGEKRIGMALSDPLLITAQGLKTIICDYHGSQFKKIAEIVREQNVSLLVIGMPYNMSGTEGEATQRVRTFAEELQKFVSIPIKFLDERLTSVASKRALIEMGIKTGRNKELVDRTSAIFLLQQYLETLEK